MTALRARALNRYDDEAPVVIVGAIAIALLVGTMVVAGIEPSINQTGVFVRQAVIVMLVALGQTIVVITGGIDMSVGGIAMISALAGALIMTEQPGFAVLAIPAGLAVGALVGLVNGGVIVLGRAAPFIVTIGMFAILKGLALTITNVGITGFPEWYGEIFSAEIAGVPAAVGGMGTVVVAVWFLLHRTAAGPELLCGRWRSRDGATRGRARVARRGNGVRALGHPRGRCRALRPCPDSGGNSSAR